MRKRIKYVVKGLLYAGLIYGVLLKRGFKCEQV